MKGFNLMSFSEKETRPKRVNSSFSNLNEEEMSSNSSSTAKFEDKDLDLELSSFASIKPISPHHSSFYGEILDKSQIPSQSNISGISSLKYLDPITPAKEKPQRCSGIKNLLKAGSSLVEMEKFYDESLRANGQISMASRVWLSVLNGCLNKSVFWKNPKQMGTQHRIGSSFSLGNCINPLTSGGLFASKDISGLLIDVKVSGKKLFYSYFDGKKYKIAFLKTNNSSNSSEIFSQETRVSSKDQIYAIERSPLNFSSFLVSTASGLIEMRLPDSGKNSSYSKPDISCYYQLDRHEDPSEELKSFLSNMKNAKFLLSNRDLTMIAWAFLFDHRVFFADFYKKSITTVNLFPNRPIFIKWFGVNSSLAIIPDQQDEILFVDTKPYQQTKICVKNAGMKHGERFFVSCVEVFSDGLITAGTFVDQIDQELKPMVHFWRKRGINEKKSKEFGEFWLDLPINPFE